MTIGNTINTQNFCYVLSRVIVATKIINSFFFGSTPFSILYLFCFLSHFTFASKLKLKMPIHVLNKTVYEKQNCNKQINLVGHFKKNVSTRLLQVCKCAIFTKQTCLHTEQTTKKKIKSRKKVKCLKNLKNFKWKKGIICQLQMTDVSSRRKDLHNNESSLCHFHDRFLRR